MTPLPASTPPSLEVLASLIAASRRSQSVTMTTPVGDLDGQLLPGHGSGLYVGCLRSAGLGTGDLVCVECPEPAGCLRVYTEVLDVEQDVVHFAQPMAIEVVNRRRAPRWDAPDGSRFLAEGGEGPEVYPLYDISVGGVCLRDRSGNPATAHIQSGDLQLPGLAPFRCELEVRHFGLRHGELRIGCAFVAMSLRDRARLAEALYSFGEPRS